MLKNYLNKGSKFFRTDLTYVASGGSWILASNIISSIASFILVIAFGNLLSPTTYGIYQYVISIAGILATPTLAGINTAMVRAIARGLEGSFKIGLKTKIRWGLLGGLASLILALYYYFNNNNTLSISFLITATFLPFMDSFGVYGSVLTGRKMFGKSTFYTFVISLIRVTTLVTLLFLTDNVLLIIFAYFATTTTLRLLFLIVVTKTYDLNDKTDPSLISYGKHLSLMTVLGNISSNLDKILLFQFLGAAELATYSFALAPISRLKSFLTPIETLAFPKFSERDPATLKKTLPRKMFLFFLIILGIVGIYIISAPFIYKILLPNYVNAVPFTMILALSLLFVPQKLLAGSLTAHSQKKALYVITTVGPIVKILTLLILLPIIGIWGAVVAFLIPLAINGILAVYYFRKM